MDVREFQRWMEERYGERDRARGLHATLCWFVEEVGEVSQALRKGTREQQEHEFADAFAWLVSTASLAGIDVQSALEKHYAAGCPKCGGIPCVCPVLCPGTVPACPGTVPACPGTVPKNSQTHDPGSGSAGPPASL